MDEIVTEISSVITNAPSIHSMNVLRQAITVQRECKICAGPARYSYYGAIVCQSCKMYFRRNAENGKVS